MNKGAVNEMVKFADTNGNGKISSSEVQAALTKAGASTALTTDLVKAFKDETDGKQVSKADIMKAALDGAKAAIKNGDATEAEISGALEYIAKNGHDEKKPSGNAGDDLGEKRDTNFDWYSLQSVMPTASEKKGSQHGDAQFDFTEVNPNGSTCGIPPLCADSVQIKM